MSDCIHIFHACFFVLLIPRLDKFVPGCGMSHHFLDGGQVTEPVVLLLTDGLFLFFLYFSLLVFFFALIFLFFSDFDYVSFPQVCRAALLWENKYGCLSVCGSMSNRAAQTLVAFFAWLIRCSKATVEKCLHAIYHAVCSHRARATIP